MKTKVDGGKEIQIKCFGKLAIFLNGEEQSTTMNSMKARELIAFLMTCRGEVVHKEKICEALWMDKQKKKRKDSFYKLLGKVKKMPISFHIKSSREMIQLCLDNIECDIVYFEELLADKNNIKKKEEAVKLYNRGLLFEEENYNWINEEDGHYDNMYMDAVYDLYEYYKEIDKRKALCYKKMIDYLE